MTNLTSINPDELIAIDTHVHIESNTPGNAADEAARKYFGDTGLSLDREAFAQYYRSRKIACVVFPVDERLTGRTLVSNDDVLALAAKNPDVMIPFASVDPNRGEFA